MALARIQILKKQISFSLVVLILKLFICKRWFSVCFTIFKRKWRFQKIFDSERYVLFQTTRQTKGQRCSRCTYKVEMVYLLIRTVDSPSSLSTLCNLHYSMVCLVCTFHLLLYVCTGRPVFYGN